MMWISLRIWGIIGSRRLLLNLLISAGLKSPRLHPVFGLDEDWNGRQYQPGYWEYLDCIQSSGWMRIGTALPVVYPLLVSHCIQSSGWMRIGTYLNPALHNWWWILHPVFGLDEDWNSWCQRANLPSFHIASSLRAGWGLELPRCWSDRLWSIELHPVFGMDAD